MMDMMSMEGFGNPFMPFGSKLEDSADDGEFDDDDEDFEFDDEEGGYDLDDDYDEGDMLDVKPPIGMKAENGLLEGMTNNLLRLIKFLSKYLSQYSYCFIIQIFYHYNLNM